MAANVDQQHDASQNTDAAEQANEGQVQQQNPSDKATARGLNLLQISNKDIAAFVVHVAKKVAQDTRLTSPGAIVNELIGENVPVESPCTALHNIIDSLSDNANYHRLLYGPNVTAV
ncbi:hypothetical protein LSH36_189g04029 [Paralvinella palmiformis]|uniref:Uncharacterized protein n=1 Tax=Paralvinella palmiformis TaxID=53620 RepID=A0AAD9N584_9ANNE|nr:hypothetical protein LSH36_189g04029 [Paralvinella palmiformis]